MVIFQHDSPGCNSIRSTFLLHKHSHSHRQTHRLVSYIMTPDLTYLGWIESTVSMSAVGPYLMEKREKKTRIPARMNNIRVKKR